MTREHLPARRDTPKSDSGGSGITSRTLVSDATGGLDLRLDYGTVKVVVGGVGRIEVELSTEDPADSPAAKAIRDATIATMSAAPTSTVGSGREVARRGDGTYAKVVVPDQPRTTGSVGGVTFLRGGGVSVQNVGRNMRIVGDRVFVDGVEVTPDGKSHQGIKVEVRLPANVDLRIDSEGADVLHQGEALFRVVCTSTAGRLNVLDCSAVKVRSVSGDARVRRTGHAEMNSTSGDLRVGQADSIRATSVSGDVVVSQLTGDADVSSTSGDVTITAVGGGGRQMVTARTVSGDVEVRDPNGLYGRGLLTVNASTVSGDVDAPGHRGGNSWGW